MIPVLIKTELRKASENELKLNKMDPQVLFQRLQPFVLVPKKVTSVFPIVTVVVGFNHHPSAELN